MNIEIIGLHKIMCVQNKTVGTTLFGGQDLFGAKEKWKWKMKTNDIPTMGLCKMMNKDNEV